MRVLFFAGVLTATCSVLLGAEPRFQRWKATREFKHKSRITQDICSHADKDYLGKFGFLTAVHETQHWSTSNARSWASKVFRRPVEALYCLEDRVLVFEKPVRTTMSRVSNTIPASLRGDFFNTYLVQYDRGWETAPVYLLDEWTAYTHECMARHELDITAEPSSLVGMTELMVYSCIFSMLEPDNQEIADYIGWNAARGLGLSRGHQGPRKFLSRLDRPENARIKAHMVVKLGLDILEPGE